MGEPAPDARDTCGPGLSRGVGRPLDGILGMPLLTTRLWTVDPVRSVLRIEDGALPTADADDVLTALLSEHADLDTLVPENPMSVDRLQWEHIQRVLGEHEGNISATARALGMHRRTLQRKLQKRPVRR